MAFVDAEMTLEPHQPSSFRSLLLPSSVSINFQPEAMPGRPSQGLEPRSGGGGKRMMVLPPPQSECMDWPRAQNRNGCICFVCRFVFVCRGRNGDEQKVLFASRSSELGIVFCFPASHPLPFS